MARPGSIVVGTDGSDRAERALDRAGELASLLGVKLHIVSCYGKRSDGAGTVAATRRGPMAGNEQDGDRPRPALCRSSATATCAGRSRERDTPLARGAGRRVGAGRRRATRPDDHRRQPGHDRRAARARIGAQPGLASCPLRRADRRDGLTLPRLISGSSVRTRPARRPLR